MKLQEALDRVEQLDDMQVVFAKRPWSLEAETLIGRLDSESRVPKALADQGFDYFLDVAMARQVLEVFERRKPTEEERRALLLYYAENDAYPSWVYEIT
jgi:hypothetical protein